ncbi:MAG: YqgE/AlgH family protein [Geodermatophilaceae bacterium]|nr:YqgE/AlgH family protein [Geodermatophilaceae bacterium]MDQ3475505.1 YqgE/AlgH family protein [Actinomycetota bacterium]
MSAYPSPDRDRQPSTAHLGWVAGAGQDIVAAGLLIAMPVLADPNFSHTVIFVLEHSAEGTVGVVLNRPSEVSLEHVLPTWASLATASEFFHVGGPCQTDAALCLARGALLDARAGIDGGRAELAALGLKPTGAGVFLADLDVEPAPSSQLISDIRVFAGYAGWSAGQLAAEIAEGAWLCLPALPEDVFTTMPATLWRTVLSRQRGPLGILRSAPEDPALN